MFDPTNTELDLGFLTDPYASNDDGGNIRKEEEGDETIGWLEATSDLQAFMNIGALPEIASEDQGVKSVMNDVEQLLQDFENATGPTPAIDDTFPQEEMDAGEQLLDELHELLNDSEFNLDNFETSALHQQQEVNNESNLEQQEFNADFNVDDLEPSTVANQNDSFIDVSNVTKVVDIDMTNVTKVVDIDMSYVTKVVTEDGKEVYIVTTSHPVAPTSASSPDTSSLSDDSEWTPTTSKGRPLVNRNAAKKSSSNRKSPYYIKDKKERKKHQNVQAARKYRDKKKEEQNKIENEEQFYATKNNELKSQVAELEAEVKTMKKLMTELGIIKM